MRHLVLFVTLLAVCSTADARCYRCHHRSLAAKHEFKREHPCPSTGLAYGRCVGWIVDHRQGLCVGGADEPSNMEWQSLADSKAKDRWECDPGWQEHLRQFDQERAGH